jgi:hypothetical protein
VSIRVVRRVVSRRAASLAVLLSVLPLALGCERRVEETVAAASPTVDHGDGIPWFGGTVEEAFAKAKAERRPVFLYWGAVWCPPCHVLRTRLFPRPEFRARLAATVPVYLDGDTERAQIWGEKLKTAGYPTVIVFDADGREVMRINALISVDQYMKTLAAALDATRPIPELVEQVDAAGAASLTPAERNLLAFYSWYQDQTGLDLAGRRALFDRLWRETPDGERVEKARFLMLWLGEAAGSDDATPALAMAADERARRAAVVREILAERELRNTNLDVVLYGAGDAVWLMPEPGAEREALVAAWNDATLAVENDERLTAQERLAALFGALQLVRLDVPEGESPPAPSAELQERVRARVRWASETVTDKDELQGVMNTMGDLLESAGMVDEVRALLAEKGAQTVAPYYFVSWQAALEEDAGRAEEAVRLYREAWQGARAGGSGAGMTPLRWGTTYLRKAMTLTPEANPAIAADSATILAEALATSEAFVGGNWSRLQAITKGLDAWQEGDAARGEIAAALRARIGAACPALPADGPDSPGVRCRSLAEPAAAG